MSTNNITHNASIKSIRASHLADINVDHLTDTVDSTITGGVMIDNNKLALVDCDNSSVKVVDVENKTVILCVKLPGQPWDVACVNKGQVVVTCEDACRGKLVFVNLGTVPSITKVLDIDSNCRGIVYTNNTIIVSFDSPESSVKMLNMSGEILKTIKTNQTGDKLFSRPLYIALSTDEQTIYVSDSDNHSMTTLVLDGTVCNVYTADNLRNPHGIAVDRNDNVYIAEYSNNIYQLSTDGKLNQVQLDSTHGLDGPQTMVYCKVGHKLYIIHLDILKSVVAVCQLYE